MLSAWRLGGSGRSRVRRLRHGRLLTALGHEIFPTGTDRILQGVITGIDFLGAGVIIQGGAGEVRGLTTAASMWAVTSIGLAIGSGHELLGILLAALIYLIVAWGDWPVLARLRRDSRQPAAGTTSERPGDPLLAAWRSRADERSGPSDDSEHPDFSE